MATAAILVNGLPASGKSTVAVKLAALLGCPVLSKDILKESFADLTGGTVRGPALGGIAMDAVWSLAKEISDGVVVESFWLSGRDDHFIRTGVQRSGATRVVELWCQLSPEIAKQRFVERVNQNQRHEIHSDWVDEWSEAQPIGLWPLVRVDTSTLVDFDLLLPTLAAHLLE